MKAKKPFCSVKEIAKAFDLCPFTLYQKIKQREIPCYRFGRDAIVKRIEPHHGIELSGYANLGSNGKPRPQSKLVNWYRRAGGSLDKRKRLQFDVFREALFSVRVINAAPDRQRKDMDPNNRRSIVADIVGVSARRQRGNDGISSS